MATCGVDGCNRTATRRAKLRAVLRDDRPLPANVVDVARVEFRLCDECVSRMAGELTVFTRPLSADHDRVYGSLAGHTSHREGAL